MTRELIDSIVKLIRESTIDYTQGPLFTDNLSTPQQEFKKLSGRWVDRTKTTVDMLSNITDEDCVLVNNWYKLSKNDQQTCLNFKHVRIVHDDVLIKNLSNAEYIYTAVNSSAMGKLISNSKTVLFLGNMTEKVAQKKAGPGIDIRCYPLIPYQEGIVNIAIGAAIYIDNLENFKHVYVVGLDKQILTTEEQITVNDNNNIILL